MRQSRYTSSCFIYIFFSDTLCTGIVLMLWHDYFPSHNVTFNFSTSATNNLRQTSMIGIYRSMRRPPSRLLPPWRSSTGDRMLSSAWDSQPWWCWPLGKSWQVSIHWWNGVKKSESECQNKEEEQNRKQGPDRRHRLLKVTERNIFCFVFS